MDVFRYELRKTLILNGGMITACAFILLFFALNVYLDMPHNYSLEREKERYFEVTEQYVITGKLDEQMIASVYSIEKDFVKLLLHLTCSGNGISNRFFFYL